MRVKLAIHAFLAQHGVHTRRAYRDSIRQFFEMFEWVDPADVTLPHAVSFKRRLIDTGRSDATVYARISALASLFTFLGKPQFGGKPMVTTNPFTGVNRSDVKPTPYGRARVADWVTFQKLIDAIPSTPLGFRDKAILLFLAATGRRRSEVANLRIRDLDLRGAAPRYTVRMKGNRIATFELPTIVLEALTAYWTAAGRSGSMRPDSGVFTAWRGSAITEHHDEHAPIDPRSINHILRRWALRANIKPETIPVHSLRHMAAHDLDAANMRIQDIQQFLGQIHLNSTAIYVNRLNSVGPAHEEVLTRARERVLEAARRAR
jgi:integrase